MQLAGPKHNGEGAVLGVSRRQQQSILSKRQLPCRGLVLTELTLLRIIPAYATLGSFEAKRKTGSLKKENEPLKKKSLRG